MSSTYCTHHYNCLPLCTVPIKPVWGLSDSWSWVHRQTQLFHASFTFAASHTSTPQNWYPSPTIHSTLKILPPNLWEWKIYIDSTSGRISWLWAWMEWDAFELCKKLGWVGDKEEFLIWFLLCSLRSLWLFLDVIGFGLMCKPRPIPFPQWTCFTLVHTFQINDMYCPQSFPIYYSGNTGLVAIASGWQYPLSEALLHQHVINAQTYNNRNMVYTTLKCILLGWPVTLPFYD